MKRFFVFVFLSLYLYNIVGYLAVFTVLQYRVRSEVKKMLKATVPEGEILTLTFHTESLEKGGYALQWIEPHEFRYNGSMYDILRTHISGDSTYFECINDVQEEMLFAHLDLHVQRHMGDSGQPGKYDSFKDVFKDSLARFQLPIGILYCEGTVSEQATVRYIPPDPTSLFHPPRPFLT